MARWQLADSSLYELPTDKHHNYRGLNVFTLSELKSVSGITKRNEKITGQIQSPLFTLSPEERIGIMQTSSYVHAVISSRMNRISSLNWEVIHKKEIEDEFVCKFRDLRDIYNERSDMSSLEDLLIRHKIRLTLKQELPDLKDDFSNFDASLLRYKKRYQRNINQSKNEITTWINNSNIEDDFIDFTKKWVESLLVHGAVSIYKDYTNEKLDNFYILPGGTVYPLRSYHVGSYMAYAQMILGTMPKIYFADEITFTNYLPSACRSYGYVPLDALINKIAEQILFDQLAAERADGTKPPEKLIIFGDQRNPFGDLTGEIQLPVNPNEQKRIEEKVNTARKGAIATLSGIGTPIIADISKADTFAAQAQRQDKLLRDIALVYNMTNMEINLAGGEFTSGKETSESQSDIEEGKGTRPIIQKLELIMNRDIIPYRFGTDFVFKFSQELNEYAQIKLDAMRASSGTWTRNEIRVDRGDTPIFEEGNDSLQQAGPQPDGSEANPLNMKAVE